MGSYDNLLKFHPRYIDLNCDSVFTRLQILGAICLGDLSFLMGPKKDINVQFVHFFFFFFSHCKDKNDNFQKYILELKSEVLTLFCKFSVFLF